MAVGRVILAGVAFLLWAAPTAAAARPLRLLYVGDWAGPREVFVADPARPGAVGQVTSGRPAFGPIPSPDGRRLLYRIPDGETSSLWVARADGAEARPLSGPSHFDFAAWSPDST